MLTTISQMYFLTGILALPTNLIFPAHVREYSYMIGALYCIDKLNYKITQLLHQRWEWSSNA